MMKQHEREREKGGRQKKKMKRDRNYSLPTNFQNTRNDNKAPDAKNFLLFFNFMHMARNTVWCSICGKAFFPGSLLFI